MKTIREIARDAMKKAMKPLTQRQIDAVRAAEAIGTRPVYIDGKQYWTYIWKTGHGKF